MSFPIFRLKWVYISLNTDLPGSGSNADTMAYERSKILHYLTLQALKVCKVTYL